MAVNPPASRADGEADLANRSGAAEDALIARLIQPSDVDRACPQFTQ
jgi:hypothetical protein